jgi:hypothetical protein
MKTPLRVIQNRPMAKRQYPGGQLPKMAVNHAMVLELSTLRKAGAKGLPFFPLKGVLILKPGHPNVFRAMKNPQLWPPGIWADINPQIYLAIIAIPCMGRGTSPQRSGSPISAIPATNTSGPSRISNPITR